MSSNDQPAEDFQQDVAALGADCLLYTSLRDQPRGHIGIGRVDAQTELNAQLSHQIHAALDQDVYKRQ